MGLVESQNVYMQLGLCHLKYKLCLTDIVLGFIVLKHDMLNKQHKWAEN